MKLNKIICDICGKEMDIEKEPFLAAYQKIEITQKMLFKSQEFKPEENVQKIELDFCRDCSIQLDKKIEEMKSK